METNALERLRAFRQAIYTTFGCRRDALIEILDALLTSPAIEHPVHLSLAAGFQRTWGSIYDALNEGTMPLSRLEHLVAELPLETSTAWYAVDASVWPRCDAETSPQRGYYPHHSRHSNGKPIVAGWNYSWLVQIPERCSSWTAPLRVRRMLPGENNNQVAAEQIRSFLHQRRAEEPSPIFTFDAGYEPVQLGVALAGEAVGILVRLRSGRCFYADPPAEPMRGRPRRHGSKFVCDDPTTWPAPTSQWSASDGPYGWVHIQCWSGLHAIPQRHAKRGTRQGRPIVRGSLIRLEVEHLPKPTKVPVPLWLWWWGPDPPDLETIWRVYIARFSIEHMFRFLKQILKWTTPKLRSPDSADRWTWLVILAYVQLRLARPLVGDHRLPWQPPLPAEKLTPARVRRGFSQLLPTLGCLASIPKPCGRSPGRPKGRRSRPAKRIPAVKLTA
jgi:DDE superfamily endonuclease